MSSPSPIKPPVTPREDLVAIPISARPGEHIEPAANDDESTFSFRGDPLLGMAAISIALFLVLAALIAFS